MLSKQKNIVFSFSIILFVYATAFKFAIVLNGFNILLISISCLTIVLYRSYLIKLIPNQLAFYLVPLTLLIPILTNYETFRLSSFLYGLMFLFVFQIILNFIYKGFITRKDYQKILRIILRSYFIVFLIQSILFPFGIYFNQIWNGEVTRLNGLATEPSYAGIIVVILLYSYLLMEKLEAGKKFSFKSYFEYFFYVTFIIVQSKSVFGVIFFGILLLWLFKKNITFLIMLFIIALFSISIYLDSTPLVFVRIKDTFYAIGTFDIDELVRADHSGSIRIAPLIIFVKQLDLLNFNAWIGYGIGYSTNMMFDLIPFIVEDWPGSFFFPSFFMDNGLLSTIIFFWFIRKNAIDNLWSLESIFLILMFINSYFNSQLFWIIIILFTVNKFFYRLNLMKYKRQLYTLKKELTINK